jgi:hypothetical protein
MNAACGISWILHFPPLPPLTASSELAYCSESTERSSDLPAETAVQAGKLNPLDVYHVLAAGLISFKAPFLFNIFFIIFINQLWYIHVVSLY